MNNVPQPIDNSATEAEQLIAFCEKQLQKYAASTTFTDGYFMRDSHQPTIDTGTGSLRQQEWLLNFVPPSGFSGLTIQKQSYPAEVPAFSHYALLKNDTSQQNVGWVRINKRDDTSLVAPMLITVIYGAQKLAPDLAIGQPIIEALMSAIEAAEPIIPALPPTATDAGKAERSCSVILFERRNLMPSVLRLVGTHLQLLGAEVPNAQLTMLFDVGISELTKVSAPGVSQLCLTANGTRYTLDFSTVDIAYILTVSNSSLDQATAERAWWLDCLVANGVAIETSHLLSRAQIVIASVIGIVIVVIIIVFSFHG